jgi:hypothetical protein
MTDSWAPGTRKMERKRDGKIEGEREVDRE